MPTAEQHGVFDEITEIGEKYRLTTSRFMELIGRKSMGERVSRETIMRDLMGPDYDQMDEGKRNLIFTTLVEPDLEHAVELGVLKKASGKNEYERS